MPLDRRARRLLDMLAAAGAGAPTPPDTPVARRAALEALAAMADEADAVGVSSRDTVAEGPAGPIPLRVYAPHDRAGHASMLVFFHGGGWVAGSLATHAGFCARLAAAADAAVVAVDYRLAPEHRFPAAFDDCLAAARWALGEARRAGARPVPVAVGGDSVGAGLAAAVARELGAEIAAQLLVCPILDVARAGGSREAFAEGYFLSRAAFRRDLADYLSPGVGAADPRVSPLCATDFAALPPAIVHTAEFDPFRDEGEAYAEALRAAGSGAELTRHAGMIHYFYALARAVPYAKDAATVMGAQLKSAFARAS